MACAKPNRAWQRGAGGRLRFKPPEPGDTIGYHEIAVPCGYCEPCREEYARQTAVKLHHESLMHEFNAFITLTYADEHLPQYNSLQYEDLRTFWKRERQRLWRTYGIRIRHYSVGEYGDETMRPHYHAIVFGWAYLEDRIILRETPTRLWTNPHLAKSWGKGNVSVGAVNYTTASYTASYVTKKLRSGQQYVRLDPDTGELIPLEQPRAIMSDNLAKTWWTKYGHQLKDNDYVVINGVKQKPPKVYDNWLAKSDPDFLVNSEGVITKAPKINEATARKIKAKRQELAKAKKQEQSAGEGHAHAQNARARAERRRKSKKI